MSEDGWIPHDGSRNPFELTIEVRLRDGRTMTGHPGTFAWLWFDEAYSIDIIAYRVLSQGDISNG